MTINNCCRVQFECCGCGRNGFTVSYYVTVSFSKYQQWGRWSSWAWTRSFTWPAPMY